MTLNFNSSSTNTPFERLSVEERKTLTTAIEKANEEFYDDQLGVDVRTRSLESFMRRIIKRAIENGDSEKVLKDWAMDFLKMFWEAGRSDYLFDRFEDSLEEMSEAVKMGRRMTPRDHLKGSRRLRLSFKPQIKVEGVDCSTASDIWTQYIDFQIDTLEKRIWKQIEEDYQNDSIKLEHYSETTKVYLHHLRLNLLRRRYCENANRALEEWQRIERTVKALQALVDEKVSLFRNWVVSPLFELHDLIERMNPESLGPPVWFSDRYDRVLRAHSLQKIPRISSRKAKIYGLNLCY